MKFFIDTANLEEIAEAKSWGCLAGVTTNPSLYAKTGGALADFEPHMQKIAELCKGLPVSAETTATTVDGMDGGSPRSPRISSSNCPSARPVWQHAEFWPMRAFA